MEGRAGIVLTVVSFSHFRSGVDFTVVRDSVILLERKPLPRLHLTTGATALLECKVIHVVLISLLFVILECGRVGLWQGG